MDMDRDMSKTLKEWSARYTDLSGFESKLGDLVATGFFRGGTEILINRTPGRLDLMGGNDDYTGGLVLESTIRESTRVAVQARTDRSISIYNPAVKSLGWQERIDFDLADLIADGHPKPVETVRSWSSTDANRAWCAYVVGDLYFLIRKYPEKVQHGFALYIESDVPLGKGVSSSAALEVAPMKILAKMYGIDVEGVELASWTQWVEIALTKSACGIMDQLAVVMGDEGFFVPMLCQPCKPLPLVRLPENLRIWGLDSGVRHSVAGIEYESARAATFMGYRLLCEAERLQPVLDESGALPRWVDPKWNGYLANLSPSEFSRRYDDSLPASLSGADFSRIHPVHLDCCTSVRPDTAYPVRGATRYAVQENWRVHAFYALIAKSATPVDAITARLLGELMYQSHVGYGQCGLGSDATDKIVELVRSEEGCGLVGAKITGGGAGGTAAILGLNTPEAEVAFQRVVEKYHRWKGQQPYVFEGSSPGSDRFGVQRISF
jgi:galactokinase